MDIKIRELREDDCKIIFQSFNKQGWNKPEVQYQNYLEEQSNAERVVLVAYFNDDFAGYLTIKWNSHYPPFKQKRIPEIMDLNVLRKYQNNGVATRLMDEAEKAVSTRSDYVGIGVGLTKDYGIAQMLYVKRGYIPDGNGISENRTFPNSWG